MYYRSFNVCRRNSRIRTLVVSLTSAKIKNKHFLNKIKLYYKKQRIINVSLSAETLFVFSLSENIDSKIIQDDSVASVRVAQLVLLASLAQVLVSPVSVGVSVSAGRVIPVYLFPVPGQVATLPTELPRAPPWVPISQHQLDFVTRQPAYRTPPGYLPHF